jgi:Bacterial SH3 domain
VFARKGAGMVWRVLGLILVLAATESQAGSSALSGDEIKQTVAGAVFAVDAPLGAKLPISYAEDGRMSGEAGALAYHLGSPTDRGSWWVSSNRLCQKWRRWFDGAVHCLRLSQEGTRIFWRRDDGEAGTASIVSRAGRALAEPDHRRQQEVRANAAKPAVTASSAAAAILSQPGPVASARGDVDVADEVQDSQPPSKPQAAAPVKSEESKSPLRMAAAPVRPPGALRASGSVEQPTRSLPSFRVAGVDYDDVLNVRNGPSADHSVIGRIAPDAAGIKIVGSCISAWCPIQHRGITGWVNSVYLLQIGRE